MRFGRKPSDITLTVVVENHRSVGITFQLEPWGETYPMPAGSSFQINAKGPQQGALIQVEETDDEVIVYGWPGSTVQVLQDGAQVGP
jgi:hypothetical protein